MLIMGILTKLKNNIFPVILAIFSLIKICWLFCAFALEKSLRISLGVYHGSHGDLAMLAFLFYSLMILIAWFLIDLDNVKIKNILAILLIATLIVQTLTAHLLDKFYATATAVF